jgi:hypothetical protein
MEISTAGGPDQGIRGNFAVYIPNSGSLYRLKAMLVWLFVVRFICEFICLPKVMEFRRERPLQMGLHIQPLPVESSWNYLGCTELSGRLGRKRAEATL